jgi:hypothetical protein
MSDPFEDLDRDLDFWNVSDQTVELVVPSDPDLPAEDQHLRFVVYAGLFELLAERAVAEAGSEGEAEAADVIGKALSSVNGIEPTLRYWLFEKGSTAERQELVGRMRGREVAMHRDWMIPRLRQDIEAYRARIAALRAVLEERAG